MDTKTAYQVLGVNSFCTKKEIRKRYLALCKIHHPDVAKPNNNIDFTKITTAYEFLNSNRYRQQQTIVEHTRINTSVWTRKSYSTGLGLAALTFLYFYSD
ncbi:hypothetical protein EDC96DRAFT_11174 [Choanephora cucurbitarum]|uniref:J domain-containing protein n=1 Tax=Choanephora cucurbitarum TaxID=101091 RepID=A0A1C7NRB4_9FUNG|nr:hypothetical protein EDC96DRAFT_11174 [Choanephora cucurbitarum]OBZ91675.1 hypothetical protein A0J61_00243 [Choanephora cucurbitarum]